MKAAHRRSDAGRLVRLLHASWFLVFALLPRPAARRLAERSLGRRHGHIAYETARKLVRLSRFRRRTRANLLQPDGGST